MTAISNGLPHNPYQGNTEKQIGHETAHVTQLKGGVEEVKATEANTPVGQPGDRFEQDIDQLAASVLSLPDTQTIGEDIQAIDGQFVDPGNAQTATPLLQFLTSDIQQAAANFGGPGGGITPTEASRNELPAEINSNPNPGKDPMLELIEGMKASLRQIGN